MVQEVDFNTLMSKINKENIEFCGIKPCKDLIVVMFL